MLPIHAWSVQLRRQQFEVELRMSAAHMSPGTTPERGPRLLCVRQPVRGKMVAGDRRAAAVHVQGDLQVRRRRASQVPRRRLVVVEHCDPGRSSRCSLSFKDGSLTSTER